MCVKGAVRCGESCLVCLSVSLVAVIVVFVITAEGRETPETDSI